ncbi:MAG: hypothetical protein QE285_02495 [Aquabacterium sp.]|nr:hypothetical protein [Aquabacterium sp.]
MAPIEIRQLSKLYPGGTAARHAAPTGGAPVAMGGHGDKPLSTTAVRSSQHPQAQVLREGAEVAVAAEALQHLSQHQVADRDRLAGEQTVKPRHLRRVAAAIDPALASTGEGPCS